MPKFTDAMFPPLRIVTRLADTVTTPPSPEDLKTPELMPLPRLGLRGENPITCTESEAFTVAL
ncbi:MAG: hypothetical protein RLP02_28090, partial [Coleofasciculus sp. C2-GNP5-27]